MLKNLQNYHRAVNYSGGLFDHSIVGGAAFHLASEWSCKALAAEIDEEVCYLLVYCIYMLTRS